MTKRFTETISTGIVTDNRTGMEYKCEMRIDNDLLELLNELADENEQLKERNENQYQQLNELWRLIEAKDWETLTKMNNQMKEDEKRLQNEWKCYE